jgi:hypothetical protein
MDAYEPGGKWVRMPRPKTGSGSGMYNIRLDLSWIRSRRRSQSIIRGKNHRRFSWYINEDILPLPLVIDIRRRFDFNVGREEITFIELDITLNGKSSFIRPINSVTSLSES